MKLFVVGAMDGERTAVRRHNLTLLKQIRWGARHPEA